MCVKNIVRRHYIRFISFSNCKIYPIAHTRYGASHAQGNKKNKKNKQINKIK